MLKCQRTSDASALQVLLDKAQEAEEAYSRRAFRPGEAGGSGLGSAHRAGPCPDLRSATGQPVSCLWGRPCCSQGSWLRVAGCGPKAITHSSRPLLLCLFSPLPAILRTSEAREQPVTWQPQGQAGNEGQEHLGQTTGKKHVRFRGDEQGAGEDREAGAAAMWKAKASHPQVAGRQVASRIKDRRCSLRAESSLSRDTKGHASRPPLLPRDSVKLLRQRQMAKEDRPAQAEPRETAASPSHRECSLPEEPSTSRSGLLPPIRNRPESPRSPPPRTTAPRRRPPTPYPFLPRDSVKLLRQRQMATKDRPAQAEPQETAASPSHRECSLPEEPSTSRSGLLPPIRNRPESPRSPPPRTTAPRRRPPTPYPR